MKLRALLTIIGLAPIVLLALHTLTPAEAAFATAGLDPAGAQMILGSTVQIALFEYDSARAIEVGGRGLGTVVHQNGETLIVTHDHWSFLSRRLHQVEFRDAQGTLLLTVSGDRFRKLIRYRDGGTMLLSAPPPLSALPALAQSPSASSQPALAESTPVWVTRRARHDGGITLEVVGATFKAHEALAGRPTLRLHGAEVLPGDSGGGIWHDRHLLGNVWSGGTEIYRTSIGGLLVTGQRTTRLIFGAELPAQLSAGGSAVPLTSLEQITVADQSNLPEG